MQPSQPSDKPEFFKDRTSYERGELTEATADPDPFTQFANWFAAARMLPEIKEPAAMTLATVADGRPSARIVLLRGFDRRGLAFFTNYDGRKGRELTANPTAALVFFWAPLERQIRVEGSVERVSPAESDAYFSERPRGSQLSAWASPQSTVVGGREALESRMSEMIARFPDAVPRPPNWGGFRVIPSRFEFWQGRPSRLHDRIVYDRTETDWQIVRLAP